MCQPMETFTIALLQLLPGASQEETLEKGLDYCRQAKAQGADLALFPEMWNTGYTMNHRGHGLESLAIDRGDDFFQRYQALAQELDLAIGLTYLERHDPAPRNTLTLIDRHGLPVLTYAKVHTCDFADERHLIPGDNFPVVDLDTPRGPVKIGAMICYDREFPESARILMLQGAEVILVPNACPMEINRISQLRGRAYENMVAIATVNYPHPHPDCNGHSTCFDGIAYRDLGDDGAESRDTLVVEAGENQGIYLAPIPLAALRRYRQSEVHGNAYRHPAKYHLLTQEKIDAPFLRPDYRK